MNTEFRLFPEQASSLASSVDWLLFYLLGVSLFFTISIAGAIVFLAIRYRRGSSADRTGAPRMSALLETIWIGIPALLSVAMFVWGAVLYFRASHVPAGAMELHVVARQWMWKFQHSGGQREINTLHVPLGRPVRLSMISQDVIHSLYFPAFRLKHDVLPGRYTQLWFEASQLGEYHLFCAEYCGAKHSQMVGKVVVLEPTAYEAWLAAASPVRPPAESGQSLYQRLRCGGCHDAGEAEASRGPTLASLFGKKVATQNGAIVDVDDNYLRESILNPAAKIVSGYQALMPAYEGQVDEEQVLDLVAYLKTLGQKAGKPQEP